MAQPAKTLARVVKIIHVKLKPVFVQMAVLTVTTQTSTTNVSVVHILAAVVLAMRSAENVHQEHFGGQIVYIIVKTASKAALKMMGVLLAAIPDISNILTTQKADFSVTLALNCVIRALVVNTKTVLIVNQGTGDHIVNLFVKAVETAIVTEAKGALVDV